VTGKRIAFYAPLKSPDFPIPSGDRLMARSLVQIMQNNSYTVDVVSQLRARCPDPQDEISNQLLLDDARKECALIEQRWKTAGVPAAWFCYHPYYKSPDLLGPDLCRQFNVPYITAEASFSERRSQGFWAQTQQKVVDAINLAAVNVYFTERDRLGLEKVSTGATLAKLRPFIEPLEYAPQSEIKEPLNLITVAMMREGDKFASYQSLSEALALVPDIGWCLHIVGDGPMLPEVQSLFSGFPEERLVWHGQLSVDAISDLFTQCALYIWPGWGEAYGLAYLEAQSAGLPVIAFDTAGVSEVVTSGATGQLVEAGNVRSLANAVRYLIVHAKDRLKLSENARQHVLEKHSFQKATKDLQQILQSAIECDV